MGNMSNNNSIWFAADKYNRIIASTEKPERGESGWGFHLSCHVHRIPNWFPTQAITGRTLTWDDEPMEWKPGERQFKIPSEKDFEKELSYTTDYAQFINGANWAIEQIKKLNQ
jgi:hypothetical protein